MDDALVEAVARAMLSKPEKFDTLGRVDRRFWLNAARAALAVAVPVIEARERERCAKIVEGMFADGWIRFGPGTDLTADIAAAIRQGPNEGEE